jgi:hypothetical protein
MNRTADDARTVARQQSAVVAMFTQLNELWYLSHPRPGPSSPKR